MVNNIIPAGPYIHCVDGRSYEAHVFYDELEDRMVVRLKYCYFGVEYFAYGTGVKLPTAIKNAEKALRKGLKK